MSATSKIERNDLTSKDEEKLLSLLQEFCRILDLNETVDSTVLITSIDSSMTAFLSKPQLLDRFISTPIQYIIRYLEVGLQ